MTQERVVVVGNGIAGFRFCELLADSKPGRFRTVVFGEERFPAYDRVHLTRYLEDPRVRELLLAPRVWYESRGIELRIGDSAVAIDRRRQVVRGASGYEVPYDRLILATGSYPFVPPIEGSRCKGVFLYRTIEDLEALRTRTESARSAVVLGGGLLGLEAARALQERGLAVSVLETAGHLMPRQLDPEAAESLRRQVEGLGIRVLLSSSARRIRESKRGVVIELGEGKAMAGDLVVIAAGVRPRDELASAAGLKLGPKGGVVVDDGMTTSDRRVLAIGECACHRGVVHGLAEPCREMARVAAERAQGDSKARFSPSDRSWRLKLAGIDAAVLGSSGAQLARVSHTTARGRRTLFLEGRRLAGVSVIGPWRELWRVGRAIDGRSRLGRSQLERFRRTGELWPKDKSLPVASWPASAQICNCKRVSRGALSARLRAGARDVQSLCRTTGAGTVCGSCRPLLAELCGEIPRGGGGEGRRALSRISIFALIACAAIAVWPWGATRRLVEDPKLSGFALLGACGLGMLLSLRKRLGWLRLGRFGLSRIFHGLAGVLGLGLLCLHTGMDTGDNFNRLLSLAFLGVVTTGGVTGVIASLEGSAGAGAVFARRYRRIVAWSHWLLLWVLPVLVGFHIVTAYYF